MKDNDSLTNKEWLTDVRDALQGQAKEIERLRAALEAAILTMYEFGVKQRFIDEAKQALGEGECKRLRAALEAAPEPSTYEAPELFIARVLEWHIGPRKQALGEGDG